MFADQRHAAFKVTWNVYQKVIDAYQAPDPAQGNKIMARLITSLQAGIPARLEEVRSLGRTMKRRRTDILAFFDYPGTSNGPTETINGLLEHLTGTARGIRNLTNHITKSLLDTDDFKPLIHPLLKSPFSQVLTSARARSGVEFG